jgi:hypothetical protein
MNMTQISPGRLEAKIALLNLSAFTHFSLTPLATTLTIFSMFCILFLEVIILSS